MWNSPFSSLASGLVFADDATDLVALVFDLEQAGWHAAQCVVEPSTTKALLIDALAQGLRFPDWTGRNLDALYDALTDLSWLDQPQVAVIVDRSPQARAAAIDGWEQIREVLFDAATWWQPHERTFVAILR